MRNATPRVFVVDDEKSVRESLKWLFDSVSLEVETFDSAQAFLDADVTHDYGCLVLDVRMQNLSGLQLQAILCDKEFPLPVIFLSAYGDAQMGAQAVKRGAIDFLQKPYRNQDLLDAVNQALQMSAERLDKKTLNTKHTEALEKLSVRENEILELLGSGMSSKEIARNLGISPKTVDVHRAHLMSKLGIKSSKDLIPFAILNSGYCRKCKWTPSPDYRPHN
jgi:two-component system response regulator TtrR